MKKIYALCLILVLLLTGCGSNVEVTTEQNDLMAEYVAGVLLKYSYEDQWEYTKLRNAKYGISDSVVSTNTNIVNSATKETTANNSLASASSNTTMNSTASTSTNSSTNTTTSSDPMNMILQGLNISGATINYNKHIVASTYPEQNLVLSVPAGAGQKVVALEFEISNPTATPIVCNTSTNSLNMKLLINNEAGISETVSMLKNDLINLSNITINPGSSYTVAAIFIVPESKANNISSLTISVAVNGGSAVSKKLF